MTSFPETITGFIENQDYQMNIDNFPSMTNLRDFLMAIQANSSLDLLNMTNNPLNIARPNSSDEAISYHVPVGIVVLLSLFYGSISMIAVIGNALVMWVVATSRKMHSVTNYFIANLALADIIIGLFAIPFQFQAALLQRWNLPYFMCAFCPFFQTVSVNVSIFTLTAIAVDRYRAIVNPLNIRPSKFRSKIAITCIWLFSILMAAPNAMALRVKMVNDEVFGGYKPVCDYVASYRRFMRTYMHTLVAMQYFIPLGIISFAYIRIGWQLWGAKIPGNAEDGRDAHVLRNKKKVIKMLFVVVALFAFCWAPLQTYYILQEIYPSINKYINYIWFGSHWLAMSNSCCNPFIYAIYNEKFKREFRYRFRWIFRERGGEVSDLERSRCQASFRSTRVTATTNVNNSDYKTGLLSSNTRHRSSSPSSRNYEETKSREVHVCIPLKSHSHLHPDYTGMGKVESGI